MASQGNPPGGAQPGHPSSQGGTIHLAQPTGNNLVDLTLHGLGDLKVYTVLNSELDQIGALTAREQLALGFLGILVGAFVSFLTASITSPPANESLRALFWFITAGSAVFSAYLLFSWRMAAKDRDKIIADIRARPPMPQRHIN